MFYSQLYRSLRHVYQSFPSQSTALALSLPLIAICPTAYGTVVPSSNIATDVSLGSNDQKSPKTATDSSASISIQSTTTDATIKSSSNKTATLNETHSIINIKRVDSTIIDKEGNKSPDTNSVSADNLTTTHDVINNTVQNSSDTRQVTSANTNNKSSTANPASNTQPDSSFADSHENSLIQRLNDSRQTVSQTLHTNKQLSSSFEHESVVRSLEKLAEFYQIKQEDLNLTNNSANHFANPSILSNNLTADMANQGTTIDANASAPVIAAKVYNRQLDNAASYRCEGTWVSPINLGADNKYKQAIIRAENEDGLNTANGLPVYAQADYAYYDNVSYLELTGDVEVIQNGQLINAHNIILDLKKGLAEATGGVLLSDTLPAKATTSNMSMGNLFSKQNDLDKKQGSGLIAIAETLAYDSNNGAATAYDVAFASVPMQAHGYAQKLSKPDDNHFQFDKVMFSTCPPTNRKWQLEANEIDINADTGRGEARNATFRLHNVPIFYLPYFNFPIDDRRSSGFLTPRASFDTDNGLKLTIPYYLNLAPNYDSTFTTDIYTNRNPMLTGEFRYLTEQFGEGSLVTAYLPHDKQYADKDRKGVFYNHAWQSDNIEGLTANTSINYVSDPKYLNDFDGFGFASNTLNLTRNAQINYVNDNLSAQLKAETFQKLEAINAEGETVLDKDRPYSRLPQLSINYRLPWSNKVEVTGVHDSAYFRKSIDDNSETEKSGFRIYNKIESSYPIEKTWGYITPKLSLQHLYTAYDETSKQTLGLDDSNSSQSAFVPQISVDSGLYFYQKGSPLGWFDDSLGGYQVLSPRLKYTYSPYVDQNDIPNFNTRVASVDYNQLFSDSWFLGYDRLPNNNNLTLGVNYRYIDAMGVTRFDGSIGDQFYLENTKTTLNTNSDELFASNSSGLAWNTSLQPYRNVWMDFNGALNAENKLNYVTSQIRYQFTPTSLVSLGFIERREDTNLNQSSLSAITASTVFPISNQWRMLAQGQYDSNNNKFIDSTLGLDYQDCCYGFSIYGRSYYDDLNLENDPNRSIMLEFKINGLGSQNSGLSRLLNDKIVAYEPVDTLWKK